MINSNTAINLNISLFFSGCKQEAKIIIKWNS